MTTSPPTVAIILVNWNGLGDTLECLGSLSGVTYPAVHVVVVDNGSAADEAGAIRAAYPAGGLLPVEVLETGANLGFTGGNNVGIGWALEQGAEYVLCLNNDTVVDPGFLEPLVQALEENPKAGVAVPHIFYCHEPNQLWYGGGEYVQDFPTFERFGGPAWHLPITTAYLECRDPYSTQVATGCALLIRASLIKTLGGFDDRFFAYYEDVDLNYRLEKQGVCRLVVPAAKIWHKESRSTGGPLSPTVHFYMTRNAWIIVRDHIAADMLLAADMPRKGKLYRRYQKIYRQKAHKLVGQNPMRKQDWERAQSILYGTWCAKHGWYGRRQENRWVETMIFWHLVFSRFKQRLLQSTVYKLRAFWFFNARWQKVLGSLHVRGALTQEHQ